MTAGRFARAALGQSHRRSDGYADPDDGLMAALPHPSNPNRAVYIVVANSALELYQMTKRHQRLPSWATFSGERITAKGYFPADNCRLPVGN